MPKEMLPLVDKPPTQYVVEEARAAEIKQFHLRHRPDRVAIEEHFDRDEELVGYLRRAGTMRRWRSPRCRRARPAAMGLSRSRPRRRGPSRSPAWWRSPVRSRRRSGLRARAATSCCPVSSRGLRRSRPPPRRRRDPAHRCLGGDGAGCATYGRALPFYCYRCWCNRCVSHRAPKRDLRCGVAESDWQREC